MKKFGGFSDVRIQAQQGDFFGADRASISGVQLAAWRHGIASPDVRWATVLKMHRDGLRHDDLAGRIGVSRPQLTNVLQGRFGLGATATTHLKTYLEAA